MNISNYVVVDSYAYEADQVYKRDFYCKGDSTEVVQNATRFPVNYHYRWLHHFFYKVAYFSDINIYRYEK